MNPELQTILDAIEPVSHELDLRIQAHLDDLTKPQGSLGRLEEIATCYCRITRTPAPRIGKKIIFTFAADHGVAAEGVSAFPAEVTPQMVFNMLGGGAAVNVLARHAGAELRVVDIGVNHDFAGAEGLIQRKVRSGTANMAEGPAMTTGEAEAAVLIGARLARTARQEGATLLGTGEMGIANTTPAAALFAALIPCPPADVTGRGTGIDDQRLLHKIHVIEQALAVNQERLTDPLNILSAVGGLEIAGICGLCLGAAAERVPVVVDGFISSAAAFVACKMNPAVKDYLFFSHRSAEAGHSVFLERFQTEPVLDLGLRLGEGTGAALAMQVIEASIKIYNEMATFSRSGVTTGNEVLL
jgi:nicotinate-nucleotide--dimethylbenzimidazole phosphoribosyltransferase